ncbi:MAG: hypothetical protein JJU27_06800 [Gammaproteobacteria bacterium]|nr:hypothetical protein [Gammaproteobacteria bacterium]
MFVWAMPLSMLAMYRAQQCSVMAGPLGGRGWAVAKCAAIPYAAGKLREHVVSR